MATDTDTDAASALSGPNLPALRLDEALSLLRGASAMQWLRGMAAGLPLAVVALGLYFVEEVAELRAPLPLFALLCALAYWVRFHMLSALAREWVSALAGVTSAADGGSASARELVTAMLAGLLSWPWVALLLVGAQHSLFTLIWAVPVMSVRGAIAPSLLARAGCSRQFGWAVLAEAAADTRGQRRLFAWVELLSNLGMLLVFANLYALVAGVLLIASSVLGLDVGFVSALVAPDNGLLLALLLGAAALALEPLRAAGSALAFHAARERREAADLRAAIAALPVLGLCLFVLAAGVGPASARAQPRAHALSLAAVDAQAREHAAAILQRREFVRQPEAAAAPLADWLARALRRRELDEDRDASAPPRFEVRLSPGLLLASALALLLAVFVWLVRGAQAGPPARARERSPVPAELGPATSADRLAEAQQLACEGAYDAALRSLYAAALLVLGSALPGAFHAARTNGQLLQQLAPGPLRDTLQRLTAQFERSWYGRQEISRADFEQARVLAEEVLRLTAAIVREPRA